MKHSPLLLHAAVALTLFSTLARADVTTQPDSPSSFHAEDFFTTFTAPPTAQRTYKFLPYDEDWRWLAKPHADHDLFDPIKYIPLSPNGDLSLSFGGSARARFEDRINPGFGAYTPDSNVNPTKNDDYMLYRWYFHGDIRYKDFARVFIEGNGDYIDGYRRNPPAASFPSDRADIHQAFLDLSPFNKITDGVGATLRVGRQEILFDSQKLVGIPDWTNTRRTFDGVRGMVDIDDFKLDLFWLRPVIVDDIHPDSSDDKTNFSGLHLSHWLFNRQNNFSFFTYYLNRSSDTNSNFTGSTPNFNPDGFKGDTDRVTIGSRFWGTVQQFDYDVEGGMQFGTFGGESIHDCGYVSTEAGYTVADWWATPRFSVGYDYASGDGARDHFAGTFNQLFPAGHSFFGYLDFVGRQNISSPNVTVTLKPTKPLKLWATWYYFALADSRDALYNASGNAIRYSPSGSAGTDVGNELDLTASYQLGRHITLVGGYCVLFPGAFIENTGKSETPQMFYTSLEFKF